MSLRGKGGEGGHGREEGEVWEGEEGDLEGRERSLLGELIMGLVVFFLFSYLSIFLHQTLSRCES